MTLIVASIRPHDVILTADGRSTTMKDGVVTGVNDHFQKLFPIPEHPIVIAHMGENQFAGMSIGAFLHRFITHLNAGDLTILRIADQLRAYAHPAVRARLQSLRHSANGCNLWVAGFGYREESPSMIEVFWKLDGDVLKTEERHFRPTCVAPGGDGARQIRQVDWHNVDGKSLESVELYHQSLLDEAINADVKPNTVGGHIHELVITPEQWQWTRPYVRGT